MKKTYVSNGRNNTNLLTDYDLDCSFLVGKYISSQEYEVILVSYIHTYKTPKENFLIQKIGMDENERMFVRNWANLYSKKKAFSQITKWKRSYTL